MKSPHVLLDANHMQISYIHFFIDFRSYKIACISFEKNTEFLFIVECYLILKLIILEKCIVVWSARSFESD